MESSGSVIRKNSASKSIIGKKLVRQTSGCDSDNIGEVEDSDEVISGMAGCWTTSCKTINEHVSSIEDYCGDVSGKKRAWADVIGAGVVGAASGITTKQIMKAGNRAAFTAAQQEFMNNVGNHIYCFIGADEAGTYGDLIEISVD